MPTFKLDGKPIPFEPGDTIIKAAWRQGIEIPHYCWHPGLSSPANCRMCLVEIAPKPGARAMMLDVLEWDAKVGDYRPVQKPKLQPSCYTPAAEGMEVLGDTSDHVVRARRDVQEFLLLNHPVDCPICDQSGECKLQDYWLEHGQYQKRMRDEPVHKPKGVVFGPTIVYDAERCVMCTRCVRFMAEVAKDPVLGLARARQPERDHRLARPCSRRALHLHDRARLPGGRAHHAGLPLQGARLVSAYGARYLPGLRDRVQRAPRLRPSLQQGLSLPAAGQREGQQVLDV